MKSVTVVSYRVASLSGGLILFLASCALGQYGEFLFYHFEEYTNSHSKLYEVCELFLVAAMFCFFFKKNIYRSIVTVGLHQSRSCNRFGLDCCWYTNHLQQRPYIKISKWKPCDFLVIFTKYVSRPIVIIITHTLVTTNLGRDMRKKVSWWKIRSMYWSVVQNQLHICPSY